MTGTIVKRLRKGGRIVWGYICDNGVDAAGKRLQTAKSGFKTKGEVSAALRLALGETERKRVEAAAVPVAAMPTFSEFFARWMQEHAARKCAPKTLERYGELGVYAARTQVEIAGKTYTFGDVVIDKFGPMAMELTINALLDHGGQKTKDHPAGKPLSPKTVHNAMCFVHGCFEKAVKWELIARNPLTGVDLPKITKKEPKTIEKGAISKLLECARGTRLFPLILLVLATGCRRGELLALQWPDIDFDSGLMNVTKSLEQAKAGLRVKPPKSGKPRRFAVPAAALAALSEHRAEQYRDREVLGVDYQDNDLVFCAPGGGCHSPNCAGIRVAKLMKKVGLVGVSLHSTRHTHASELISIGVPITTISKRMDHANPTITLAIYAHALEADELAAVTIWDDAMAGVIAASKKADAPRMLAIVSRKAVKKEKRGKHKG